MPWKAPPQMKRMLRGVDLDVLLLVVLLAAARGDVGAGAFDDLEQRLLHALAADVAGGATGVSPLRAILSISSM